MNARLLFLALLLSWPSFVWGQLSFGSPALVNNDWAFALGDEPAASQPAFDDRSWSRVDLPHDWSARARMSPDLASCTGYLPGGIGWYRKTLVIPRREGGEKVFLYFEGVYNRSEVYLNGHLLGKRPNGYVSFYYDATPHVRFDRENVIAVRVDHSRSADSRWYTGSGIYRNVFLVRSGSVHFTPWSVFVRSQHADTAIARLEVDTGIQNETTADVSLTVRHELLAVDGAMVASASETLTIGRRSSGASHVAIRIEAPHLWRLDNPYLYELRTTVTQDGRPVDRTTTRTGIRALSFDPSHGFSLNGVPTKMKGVCLHHDAGMLGSAVPGTVWRQRLQTLKNLGCNAVRTSHNPQAPDFYDLCDELGLLVLDEAFDEWEFPKRKWLRGWNLGEPGFEGSHDFFAEWSERDLADMIRRDRNHPSIFAWSIGNEVDYPNDPYSHPVLDGSQISQPMFGGFKPEQPHASRLGGIAKRLVAEAKKQDVSRPVTAALAGVIMSNETDYPGALDLTGYNYTEDRYAIDHREFPERIIYGSENRHDRKAWSTVEDHDHIFGQFLWTGIDYLGEAGPWPSRGSSAGLLDLTGAVKPRGRFREALWSDKPVLYLGTESAAKSDRRSIDAWPVWNYAPGSLVRVLCYTNAARVRLTLDDHPLGEEKAYDRDTGVISWEFPYAAGKLEAIGYDTAGAAISRATLVPSGPPATMNLSSEDLIIDRKKGVATVELHIVDQGGTRVMDANHAVACQVEGPARLLGLEAGNLRDTDDSTDAVHRVHHGRIVAYIQATGEPGSIRATFSADGVPDAAIALTAQ